ncbi:hypothetical protein GmHk_19G054693 [Glycine max]|nr:hypothetical protein GmHk_19G054693 [Glycine max]
MPQLPLLLKFRLPPFSSIGKRFVGPSKVTEDMDTDRLIDLQGALIKRCLGLKTLNQRRKCFTKRKSRALYEELTRKVVTLVAENENLKREKELALKEYESLETTNKNLKTQIAKSINTEVEKTPVEPVSSVAEITPSSEEDKKAFEMTESKEATLLEAEKISCRKSEVDFKFLCFLLVSQVKNWEEIGRSDGATSPAVEALTFSHTYCLLLALIQFSCPPFFPALFKFYSS